MFGEKKIYHRRVEAKLVGAQKLLLARLREDWEQLQRDAKRERIVRRVVEGGQRVANMLLALLAIGGAVTVAAIAPNVFAAVGASRRQKLFFNARDFRQCRYYVKRQKYARFTTNETMTTVRLLHRGKRHVLRDTYEHLAMRKPDCWDGVWHIVLFDIPNKHKSEREGFREKLCQIGMHCMQESVFITPYPCEEEVDLLIYMFSIRPYVRVMTIAHLEHDEDLRKIFDLGSK